MDIGLILVCAVFVFIIAVLAFDIVLDYLL